MISVNVKFIGNELQSLIVSGHAGFANKGKDLVCAGVSAIVIGGINALESEIDNITLINEDNRLGVIVTNSNSNIQSVLNTILIQLQTIERSYTKYLKINK